MAKISPVSIKYMIYASFSAAGPLEKPDVIGAIFGQTEGLLGSDMEMRELQKEGKIGRIEVELELVDGRSIGEIKVPTALDKTSTTLIAAALETIDKIGPTEAKIQITKIEDVRGNKRNYILERAKKLMEEIEEGESFRELSENLKIESRFGKIQEYGESKLPCGDLSGDEIIVVEGRADVVNLLRNRVNNVVGMDGSKLPPEIIELGKEKKITLFVDGDRGGKLIANNILNNVNVSYVAVAPEGREVEELSGKEILLSLRKKIPASEFLKKNSSKENNKLEISDKEIKDKLREIYEKNKLTKSALLLDENFYIIMKVGSREVSRAISSSSKKIFAVVLDGTATSSLVATCEKNDVSYLAATNFSKVRGEKVNLVSL